MNKLYKRLPEALLPWYEKNKRQLPWRQDTEAYHIHLSEIMLQQTRVEAVRDYYTRFVRLVPTVQDLARVDDELLHKLWEGLGYYSRVRNLKKAAEIIVEKYEGKYPRTYEELLALPGVGPYTAGAICSIAFGEKTAAVDGNVLRVISRLTDDDTPVDLPAYQKQVREKLQQVYPSQAGAFTQALMELGATVCGPNRKPDCQNCPCGSFCLGYKRKTAESLPVKSPKKQRRHEQYTLLILRCGNSYGLQKRPEKGLLAGLWQFPNVPGMLETEDTLKVAEDWCIPVREVLRVVDKTHIFTHVQWDMRGVYLEVAQTGGDFVWMTEQQIRRQAALPTAFRQFWEDRI